MKIPFGRYKDSEVEDLPKTYLEWLALNVTSVWQGIARDELFRRANPGLGVTNKLPAQVFVEELAKLLQKMPDSFENKEWFIKTVDKHYIFSVRIKEEEYDKP